MKREKHGEARSGATKFTEQDNKKEKEIKAIMELEETGRK